MNYTVFYYAYYYYKINFSREKQMNAAFQQEAGQGDFGRWERFGQMIHVVACINSKVFF